jgi:hypothetical protein
MRTIELSKLTLQETQELLGKLVSDSREDFYLDEEPVNLHQDGSPVMCGPEGEFFLMLAGKPLRFLNGLRYSAKRKLQRQLKHDRRQRTNGIQENSARRTPFHICS